MKPEKTISELEELDNELHNSQERFKELLRDNAEDAFINSFVQNLDNARLIIRSAIGMLRKIEGAVKKPCPQ